MGLVLVTVTASLVQRVGDDSTLRSFWFLLPWMAHLSFNLFPSQASRPTLDFFDGRPDDYFTITIRLCF